MKKLLALYVISLIALVAALPAARASTIALWTFEDGTPGAPATTVTDSVGGFNGTANNGPLYVGGLDSTIDGTYGHQGLKFNGINQNVLIPTSSGDALELSNSFTVELGLVNGGNGGFTIFMGGSASGEDPYYITVGADGHVEFHLYFGVTAATIFSDPGLVKTGELQHIAGVFDTTGATNEMRLYVDHGLVSSLNVGTATVAYTDNTENLWFGAVENNFGWFDGTLVDVRISDEPLGPEEQFAVPEPTTLAVVGLGLVGLGFSRRRRHA